MQKQSKAFSAYIYSFLMHDDDSKYFKALLLNIKRDNKDWEEKEGKKSLSYTKKTSFISDVNGKTNVCEWFKSRDAKQSFAIIPTKFKSNGEWFMIFIKLQNAHFSLSISQN